MELRNEKSDKTYIEEELDNGCSVSIAVDHLDEENPYDIYLGHEMGWSSKDDLLKLKKMINKALAIL